MSGQFPSSGLGIVLSSSHQSSAQPVLGSASVWSSHILMSCVQGASALSAEYPVCLHSPHLLGSLFAGSAAM